VEQERTEELADLMEPVARELLGEPNAALSSVRELRWGSRGSVSVDLEKGVWWDHEAGEGGGVLDLITYRIQLTGRAAWEWMEEKGIKEKARAKGRADNVVRLGNIVATYDYTDEAGQFIFQVCRFEPKDFRQRHRDKHGDWVWNIRGCRRVPYHLPELIEAIALERPIYVVEGEKDVENLSKLGFAATCNPMGAGAWHGDLNPYFEDADVIVIADNDPQTIDKKTGKPRFHKDGRPVLPGQDHANHVARELKPVAKRVRYLDLKAAWPGCPLHGDISDWIRIGGTPDQLYLLTEDLREWSDAQTTPTVPITFPFPIKGEEIPRRQWLVPGLLLRRHVSVLVAPAGSGKSLLTLQLAMMGATGMAWGGWRCRQRIKGLVINTEDDGDEMRRRLFAAAELMQCDAHDLRQYLAFAEQPESIIIARADSKTKTVVRTPMVESLIATIIENQFDVLIVDPFAETFEGDENSNSELKWAAVLWREIARRTNCAVLLVHHTRKYGAAAGEAEAARGGSALIGVARIVSTLFSMTEEEAKTFDIDPEQRGSYLRFDDAKANLTLVTFAARWFTKETITLPNAGDHEPPDEVGVLKPWQPPNAFDDLDVATGNKILDELERGVFDDDGKPTGDPYTLKKSGGGKRWAGHIIQKYLHCPDKDAQKVLQKWLQNNVIEETAQVTSTSKGKARLGLRVIAAARPGQVIEETML
jgi:hypothetical protein